MSYVILLLDLATVDRGVMEERSLNSDAQSGEHLFFRTQNNPINLKKYSGCNTMKLSERRM